MPGQVFGFEHGASRRYAELVGRLLGLEGEDAPLPPGFLLELDRPEWRILKRELAWSTGPQAIAAVAGNFGRMQVQNNSKDRIVVVTAMWQTNAVVAGQRVVVSTDAAKIVAGVVGNLALDTRVPLQAGVRRVSSQNAVANDLPAVGGNQVDEQSAGAVGSPVVCLIDTGPVILAPGTLVEIDLVVANQATRFCAAGYERPVLPDELAL